jgi:hypothetical protein
VAADFVGHGPTYQLTLRCEKSVIRAQAGIQKEERQQDWIPACAGMTSQRFIALLRSYIFELIEHSYVVLKEKRMDRTS